MGSAVSLSLRVTHAILNRQGPETEASHVPATWAGGHDLLRFRGWGPGGLALSLWYPQYDRDTPVWWPQAV